MYVSDLQHMKKRLDAAKISVQNGRKWWTNQPDDIKLLLAVVEEAIERRTHTATALAEDTPTIITVADSQGKTVTTVKKSHHKKKVAPDAP